MGEEAVSAIPIPLNLIRPGPNDRTVFDSGPLEELARSILDRGLIQPITIRPIPPSDGTLYEIVAGERRFRASQIAGLSTILAFVKEMSDEDAAVVMALENLKRNDLNPMDECDLYASRMERFGWSEGQVAERLSVTIQRVRRMLTLRRLIADARALVATGNMLSSHGLQLARHDEAVQSAAVRLFKRAGGEISLVKWTHILNDLALTSVEGDQGSLFDIEQDWGEKVEPKRLYTTGRQAVVDLPDWEGVVPFPSVADGPTGDCLYAYATQLERDGYAEGAAAVHAIYRILLDRQLVCIPNWRRHR